MDGPRGLRADEQIRIVQEECHTLVTHLAEREHGPHPHGRAGVARFGDERFPIADARQRHHARFTQERIGFAGHLQHREEGRDRRLVLQLPERLRREELRPHAVVTQTRQ